MALGIALVASHFIEDAQVGRLLAAELLSYLRQKSQLLARYFRVVLEGFEVGYRAVSLDGGLIEATAAKELALLR